MRWKEGILSRMNNYIRGGINYDKVLGNGGGFL